MPPDNRPVDGGPGRDIHRSHAVGVGGEPTRPTEKDGLVLPIPLVLTAAERTGARGPLGVHKVDGHARTSGFVTEKGLPLREGPRVVEKSPCPGNRCPSANAFQTLQSNRGAVPLGLLPSRLAMVWLVVRAKFRSLRASFRRCRRADWVPRF